MFRHLPWSHGIWFATDNKNDMITRSNFHFLSDILRESENWAQSRLKISTPQGWHLLPSLSSSRTSPWPPPSRPATRDHQALTTHCKAIVAAEPPHGLLPLSEGQDLLNMIDDELAQQAGSDSFLLPTKGSSFPGRCCWPPPLPGSLVVVSFKLHHHIGDHIDFLQNCHQFWWFPWIFANFGDFFIEIFSDSLKFSLFLVNDFSLILMIFLLGKLSPILVTFLQKILLIH